jgi:hypothetical protein
MPEPGSYDGRLYTNEYVTRWNREHVGVSKHEFRSIYGRWRSPYTTIANRWRCALPFEGANER